MSRPLLAIRRKFKALPDWLQSSLFAGYRQIFPQKPRAEKIKMKMSQQS